MLELALCYAFKVTIDRVKFVEEEKNRSDEWFLDSGASDWVCNTRSSFHKYTLFEALRPIYLENKSYVDAIGYETIKVETEFCFLEIKNVLYFSRIITNLISVKRL